MKTSKYKTVNTSFAAKQAYIVNPQTYTGKAQKIATDSVATTEYGFFSSGKVEGRSFSATSKQTAYQTLNSALK